MQLSTNLRFTKIEYDQPHLLWRKYTLLGAVARLPQLIVQLRASDDPTA